MKSTKFWLFIFSIILVLSAGAAIFISLYSPSSMIARIYQEGICIYTIDLAAVTIPYEIEIHGEVENIISVESRRICVVDTTCPDQTCVHQGWISNRISPIVCLPNKLTIQIETSTGNDVDAITQ